MGSEASGAVRSSWIGNRLISVLGMATAVGAGGRETACGVPWVGASTGPFLREISLFGQGEAYKSSPRFSGGLVAGGQNGDQDQQEPHRHGVGDEAVWPSSDPLHGRARR